MARAYRALLHLLPAAVHEQDGEETARTFEAMWREAGRAGGRMRLLLAAFGRLPAVAAAEWRDHLAGARRARGRTRGGVEMDGIGRVVRQAARGLARSPAFGASTVLLLGLGVGAVTTIFTLVDHVLLRPLPYPDAERLVKVENGAHSGPAWQDFHTLASVERWVATSNSEVNLTGEGEPLRLRQLRVTEGFFAMFGARPAAGRLLVAEDFRAADVVALSADAWERVFGEDPGVVGRTIRIDGDPVLIVGVVDRAFVRPEPLGSGSADLWRPLTFSDPRLEDRGYHVLDVAGRLAPGATLADASREAEALAARLMRDFPEHYGGDGAVYELPLVGLQEATVGEVRQGLGLLLGAVTLLLLVACANVAHLFMARGLARAREMAVRRALGARTRTLAGQVLAESLLVAAAGAALGAALAGLGLPAFLALSPETLPRADSVRLDARVLGFAVAVSALTALVFGLLPFLRAGGRDPGDALRSGGRGTTGSRGTRAARGGLVVAEVALSLMLVAQAGLLLRSFARLHDEPLGFRVEDVWTLPVRIEGEQEADADAALRRFEGIREALAATPGVRAASYGLSMPMQHTGGNRCCWRTAARRTGSATEHRTTVHPVAEDWFTVLEPRVLAGRPWSRGDAAAAPAPVAVNEPLALAMFGSVAGALGQALAIGGTGYRVAAVVGEDRHYGPDQAHGPAAYVPVVTVPFPFPSVHMVVLAETGAADLPRRLREAVWLAEPDVPVPAVRPMASWVSDASAGTRFDSLLFSAFGAVALLLAAGGLYGTLLYTVGMERRELGIRLALGAARRSIEGRVLGRGLRLAGCGAAVGVAGAWASGRFLQSRLHGVEAGDPATLAGATAVLLLAATLACWLPARRAAATDPLETLREE